MTRRVHTALAMSLPAVLVALSSACGPGEPAEQGPRDDDPVVVRIGDEDYPTTLAIYRRFDEARDGPLALLTPVGPARRIDDGHVQEYSTGTVYWSPGTGAHIVRGQILDTYRANGGPTGLLGWPVTDETTEGTLTYSRFENGEIRLEDQTIQVVEYSE